MMSSHRRLPIRTTVLIVGAGPVGLSLAIALLEQGVNDFIIVDKLGEAQNTSRAFAVHAATMEALDIIGVSAPLSSRSTRSRSVHILSRNNAQSLFSIDIHDALLGKTKFPCVHMVPQTVTEEVLTTKLREKGVEVFRGERFEVVGMRGKAEEGQEDVAVVRFAGGEGVEARYVIGADGARSIVRQLSGVSFDDPRPRSLNATSNRDRLSAHIMIADVYFSSPLSLLPPPYQNDLAIITSQEGFSLIISFPSQPQSPGESNASKILYRIASAIPPGMVIPLDQDPDIELCQRIWERFGPSSSSSKPDIGKIEEVVWSSRFKTHSAVVDRYFTRLGDDYGGGDSTIAAKGRGAAIFLIGDAAHVHPPTGGQGMNLGIRDAIYLAPRLASHILHQTTSPSDHILESYANHRRKLALEVIGLANGMLTRVYGTSSTVTDVLPKGVVRDFAQVLVGWGMEWGIWGVGRFGWIRRWVGWKLSGLGLESQR